MEINNFFETASFHIIRPCNMKCKFCYATFQDLGSFKQMSLDEAKLILYKLKVAGLKKITFAGGEPMMYRHIFEVVEYAKEIGLTTSIISNGSMLSEETLDRFKGYLDWVGVSIDSLSTETNKKIGRDSKNGLDYFELVKNIKDKGFKIKINTVVNRFNEEEDMQDFIGHVNPLRWKIFDTLRVEGQNDRDFEEIRSSAGAFDRFIGRHSHKSMVPENNEAMTGSYLLIDPKGRLFENSEGKHTYSRPLQSNNIDDCLSDISLDRDMFIKRGGIYKW